MISKKLSLWNYFTAFLFSQGALASDLCQKIIHFKDIEKRPNTSQVMVVHALGGTRAQMALCQRQGSIWSLMYKPFPAVLGKNGVAQIGRKKEGDLKTPAGFYPIGDAFGTQPLAVKMDFRYITKTDKFIDDVHHQHYNTWVNGETDAKSYEAMLTKPYTYGAVVNYNMHPTHPGAGSAIFIHLWESPQIPTAGCIAMEKKHVLHMLHWLDKAQHPYIWITQG